MKLLTPIILIVVALGLFFWQARPIYSQIQAARAEAMEYNRALEIAAELEALRGELSDKLASFPPEDLEKLGIFLPDHIDNIRTILDVDGVASSYNIVLKDIKTSEVNPQTGATAFSQRQYNTVTLSFSFTAPFARSINFLRDLETSLRLIDVRTIDIKPSAETSGNYDFNISLNTYWTPRPSR